MLEVTHFSGVAAGDFFLSSKNPSSIALPPQQPSPSSSPRAARGLRAYFRQIAYFLSILVHFLPLPNQLRVAWEAFKCKSLASPCIRFWST